MSPVFTPPVVNDLPPYPAVKPIDMNAWEWAAAKLLFRHYGGNPRGLAVVKVAGHYTTVDNPETDTLIGADGIDWFLGGHVYTVTPAIAGALAADGYTTAADPAPPGRQLPWDAVAGLTWTDIRVDYGTWS